MKADIRIFIRKKICDYLTFFNKRKVYKYAEQMGQPMYSLGPLVLSVAFGFIRFGIGGRCFESSSSKDRTSILGFTEQPTFLANYWVV